MKRQRHLMEQRHKAVTRSREILEVAERENRALTSEEQTNFDAAMADQDRLRGDIERETRLAQVEGEMAAAGGTRLDGDGDIESRGGAPAGGRESRTIGSGRYAVNLDEISQSDAAVLERRNSAEYRAGFSRYLRTGEARALDASSTGANGSYLVTPVQMALGILQRLDDLNFMRQLGTTFSLPNATSLGRVSLDTDVDDFDWTAELLTGDQTNGPGFGMRELTPHPLAKMAKISNKLLRISTIDIMGLVTNRLAYKKSLTEEKAFLTGNGVQKPLGVFTASADGVPTSRDIATGNTSTAITFEGLINAKYSLKGPYLAAARWLFSRPAISQIAKIRDDSGASAGTGQFLWQPSTQLGQPDRIHGIPVLMSENVPSTFTTGQYVGMIADFSYYHIADALDMQIQRLSELFALTNQTGMVLRSETDGMPVLAEAFARIKLG
jgi:HK97 family phage major capsid protein